MLPVLAALGGLGPPETRGFVTFEAIEREHFGAVSVIHDRGPASTEPLVLRIRPVGDAREADLDEVAQFLRVHLNVILLPHPEGAPLYLTRTNLVAPSGPAALGATTRYGMSAEMGNVALAPCVVAHEIGHFLGLKHVNDPYALMHPRCEQGKLPWATTSAAERDSVAEVQRIRAVTPDGTVTWAARVPFSFPDR